MSGPATFDRDVQGRPWAPCAACPHPTPGSCPSRSHRAYCDRLADDPATWGPRIAAKPSEDRPARTLLGPPPSPRWPRPDGRLRVGFAGPAYLSHGGTETWHRTLLTALSASGRVQVVGYAATFGDGDPAGLGRGVPLGLGIEAVRSIARACDVLVCWGFHDLAALVPPPGDPARPVVVLVLHATSEMPWARQILAEGAPHADRLVGVSSVAVAGFPTILADKPVAIIPNAIDPAKAEASRGRDDVRAELGIGPADVMVLGTHRLSIEKRVPLLAEAFRDLAPHYKLVIAGDGPERPLVEGKPGVVLLGRRDDVADLYAAADLFVSAAEHEGFGLSAAEAMESGLPVISTPVGFLAEFPGLAWIVPIAAGPDAWAEAIRSEWEDPKGRRILRAQYARAFTRERFGVPAFVAEWERYLLGLAPAKPRPRPAPALTLTGLDLARLPVWSCDYRIALVVAPEGEPGEVGPLGCGCSRPALCLLGKAHRPDGIATDGDCAACMRFDG